MSRRTFDVIDICEIFTHWHAGRRRTRSLAAGAVAEHCPQVPGRCGGRGHGTGRPAGQPGTLGRAGPGVVPGAGGHAAAAGDVAGAS